jgi:hypothetical protein
MFMFPSSFAIDSPQVSVVKLLARIAAGVGFDWNGAIEDSAKRPPTASDFLQEQAIGGDAIPNGLVVVIVDFDGVRGIVHPAHDFIARLASLVPRPRGHLILYHELIAPNARHRQTIVAAQRCQSTAKHAEATTDVPRGR